MKKILIALSFLAVAVSAQAQHHGHHGHHGYHQRSGNWVAPAIVGGVIGYALTRNYYEPVYNYGYVPPPVYSTTHGDCSIYRTSLHPMD